MFSCLSFFAGQRGADERLRAYVTGAERHEIVSRLLEAQLGVRTTTYHGGVVIVLTIILPETHRTEFKPTTITQSQIAAARTREPSPLLQSGGPRR